MRAFVSPHAGATTIQATTVAVPEIDHDEILVSVKALGVGIHDSYFLPADATYPFTIGIEASGVIEQVGSDVTDRRPGDRIAFISAMQNKGGTWAEFAAVKMSSMIIDIPASIDFARAAAVPVAGNTALKALHLLEGIAPGSSVFIAGGSGAIGTLAIQLARARGWRVAASASAANQDYMRALGAELTVDYLDPSWRDQVRVWAPGGVDGALAVQPGTTATTIPVVCDGGVVVPISGDSAHPERGVRLETLPIQIDVRSEMDELMAAIDAGTVHLELENIYPFEDAPAALAKVQTRRARGKSVILIG